MKASFSLNCAGNKRLTVAAEDGNVRIEMANAEGVVVNDVVIDDGYCLEEFFGRLHRLALFMGYRKES